MEKIPQLRPTAAYISLKNLAGNLLAARQVVDKRGRKTKIMLLVKANAYGHGLVEVSKYTQSKKLCDFLGVATIEEGLQLRQAGITLPVLVLGSIFPFEGFEYAIKNGLSFTVASVRAAKYVADIAPKMPKPALCHIKQETGMARIGSRRPAALEILKILSAADNVKVEGVYSHLSSAQNDTKYTAQQIAYFREFLAAAEEAKLDVGLKHIAASAGFLNYPEAAFDMVRLGHLAYGLEKGFEPVLTLKSRVVFIKDVRLGARVSYDGAFTCGRPSKIATVPIGYGDGYPRALSAKGTVLIRGKQCPVIGNITMDMLMVDITDLGDIPVGEEVTLIGGPLSAAAVARAAGAIDYEITTALNARVPRVYDEEF